MAFGKKKQDEGLDVLTEIKEPFSFAGFFEEHVVERAKRIKLFLEEKGILFFLLSPFQQRNRLILQLVIIVFGLMAGIVPRSMHLVDEAKERNAASEMAALVEKNTQVTVGSITVRPLASSQYENQHLLAFYISSSSGGSVPSTASRYDVKLSAARGVTDAEHVKYAYEVVPVSEDGRLLLVYTDNRKQDDTTGIYNLSIQAAEDELKPEMEEPMEVVLSNTQETNDLFGKDGVNLASLTEGILNDPNTPIAKAQGDFDKALSDYELETERIVGLNLGMRAVPDVKELSDFAEESFVYGNLLDTSTTKDIEDVTEVASEDAYAGVTYPASIEMDGTLYNTEYFEGLKEDAAAAATEDEPAVTEADGEEDASETPEPDMADTAGLNLTEREEAAMRELESLQAKTDNVLHALSALNNARVTKYEALKGYKLILNQTVDVTAFPETGTVAEVL